MSPEIQTQEPGLEFRGGRPYINVTPNKPEPSSEPDPIPFDIDSNFFDWNKGQPIDIMADNHEYFSKVLHSLSRPFLSQGYNTMSSLNRATASLFVHLDLVSQFIELSGGGKRENLFEDLANQYNDYANHWRQRADSVGINFFDELVSEAVGTAIPGITKFALDIGSGLTFPYMAGATEAYNKNQSPFANGMVEAAKTGLLGAVFQMMAPLKTYLKAPTMATIFGFQEAEGAPEGQKTKAFVKGAATGAGFALTSPGGRLGLNEIYENAKPILEKARGMAQPGLEILQSETGAVLVPRLEEIAGKYAGREARETIYQNTVNRFAAIENLDERARALGATIKPGESPRMRAREYLGLSGKVQSTLRDKTYRINKVGKIEITGEGLKPILDTYEKLSPEKDIKIRQQEFNDYFTSRRTIEDLRRPKGEWTPELIVTERQVIDAQRTLDALQKKYGNLNQFEAVADRLYDFQKRVLHNLVDSGVIAEETYQRIINLNPHYVPFDRVLDEPESALSGGAKKFTEARSPIKRIKGSEREIEDVVGSIIKHTYRIINVAERNTVARNVAKLMPIEELGIEPVNIPIRPIHVSPEEIDTITRTFRSQAEQIRRETKKTGGIVTPGEAPSTAPMTKLENIVLESLTRRGFTEGEAGAALYRIKEAAKGRGGEGIVPPTQTETIENTITKIIKETVKEIETPVESTIFRASPFKPKGNIIEYYVDGKKKYMDVPNNLYDAMSGLNEASSDLLTKIISSPAGLLRGGVTRTPEFIVRNFIRDQMDAFIQNQVGFRPGIDTIGAIADVVGKTDIYYDWLRSGGAHSTFVDLSRKNLEHITKELEKDPSAFQYLNIVQDAGRISQAIEETTRLGIYKAAIRNGKSPVEAAFMAREGTVDFGVHGQLEGLKKFSSITAFFNPAIQGTDRAFRAHIDNPIGTVTKGVAAITIPSMILWYLNKDNPDYKELPQWQKDLFWLINVGERGSKIEWVRIPKPFLLGQVYGSAPERFLTYLDSKDPNALKGFVKSLIDAATPVQGDPNGVFLPTAVKPLIENSTNWQFFKERPVVPESRKDLLPRAQYGKYTSETAKLIGKELGWSPAKIENFIVGMTGGTGKYSLDALDLALEAIQGKTQGKRPTEMADIPLIKGFVTRPVVSDPQSLRDFYQNAKEIETSYKTLRDSMKQLQGEDVKEIFKENPKLLMAPAIGSIREKVGLFDKQIELISKSKMGDDRKREFIQKIEALRLKTVQMANKFMEGKMSKEDMEKQLQGGSK